MKDGAVKKSSSKLQSQMPFHKTYVKHWIKKSNIIYCIGYCKIVIHILVSIYNQLNPPGNQQISKFYNFSHTIK